MNHNRRSFRAQGRHFALAAVSLSLLASLSYADPVDWSAYKKSFDITFPGYTGTSTLTDFPVLIRLSTAQNDFRYARCPNGDSLRFSDANGNLIPHEIDTWDPTGESLVWVKVPLLNASTRIIAHYDCAYPGAALDASQVWSNGFIGVWHLGESARPLKTSTAIGSDFTASSHQAGHESDYDNRIGFATNGVLGKAVAFDLGTDRRGGLYAFDPDHVYDGLGAVTIEFWTCKREHDPDRGRYLVCKYADSSNWPYTICDQSTDHRFACQFKDADGHGASVNPNKGNGITSLDTWNHNVYVCDLTNATGAVYVNTVSCINNAADIKTTTVMCTVDAPLSIGNREGGAMYAFPGIMDEVRISSVARSADWVKATYDTVMDDDFAHYAQPNDWEKYTHSFAVTFNGYTGSETLEDFPVLVKVSTNGIPGFLYEDCIKPNGGDLRFSDAEGNVLASEVDTWDTNGVSSIWVKVPSLSAATTIKGYYGWAFAPVADSKAVWSNGYVGVWHLGESARPLLNSTSTTGVDFTRSHNSSSDPGHYDDCIGFAESGAAGKAVRFSAYTGEDEAMQRRGGLIAYDPENKLCGFNAISLEIWAKVDEFDTTASRFLLARRVNGGTKLRPYNIFYASNKKASSQIGLDNGLDDNKASVNHYSNAMSDSLAGSWNFHCFQYDNTATYHTNYLNGAYSTRVSNNTAYSVLSPSTSFLCLGNDAQPSSCYSTAPASPQVFNGSIDEFRISNLVRSSDWVKATYDTIKTDGFATYSHAMEKVLGTILIFR